MINILKKLILSFAILFVMALSALFLFIMKLEGKFDPPLPFDRETWVHGTNENKMYFPRLRMADYLIEKDILIDKSREEVLSLLGEPELENVQWSLDDYFGVIYHLGPERGWVSVDSEWLGIRFNANGQVTDYTLLRD